MKGFKVASILWAVNIFRHPQDVQVDTQQNNMIISGLCFFVCFFMPFMLFGTNSWAHIAYLIKYWVLTEQVEKTPMVPPLPIRAAVPLANGRRGWALSSTDETLVIQLLLRRHNNDIQLGKPSCNILFFFSLTISLLPTQTLLHLLFSTQSPILNSVKMALSFGGKKEGSSSCVTRRTPSPWGPLPTGLCPSNLGALCKYHLWLLACLSASVYQGWSDFQGWSTRIHGL